MNKIIIFDTTMRDGELMPGVKFNLQQKISISKLLEEIGVDVIEVGYSGNSLRIKLITPITLISL